MNPPAPSLAVAARGGPTRAARAAAVAALAAAGWFAAPSPAGARVIGRSAEISVGREAASAVERYFRVDTDPAATARVQRIGRRLAACASDPDYPFEFHVVESPEVNAFALPGGFIYVFRGLLQLVPSDDALASVLAHEISHVTRSHAIRQFEKNLLLSVGLSAILAGTGAGGGYRDAARVVQTVAGLSFSRGDETEADEHGIRILFRAGYNPRAAADAMRLVKRASGDDGSTPALLRTHPAPDSRIRKLGELADELIRTRAAHAAPAPSPVPAPPLDPGPLPLPAGLVPAPCEWLPLRPGARWSYRVSHVSRISRVSRAAGEEPAGEGRTEMRVAEELSPGLFLLELDLGDGVRASRLAAADGGRLFLRPAGPGGRDAEWRPEAVFSGPSLPPFHTGGLERVRVPAGEFEALRVERRTPTGEVESTAWYVRGVGMVRRLRGRVVEELVQFRTGEPGRCGGAPHGDQR